MSRIMGKTKVSAEGISRAVVKGVKMLNARDL